MNTSKKTNYLVLLLLLIMVTLIGVNVVSLYAEGEPDITIDSRGQAHVTYDLNTKKIHYWCDASDMTPCRITIHRKTPDGD